MNILHYLSPQRFCLINELALKKTNSKKEKQQILLWAFLLPPPTQNPLLPQRPLTSDRDISYFIPYNLPGNVLIPEVERENILRS